MIPKINRPKPIVRLATREDVLKFSPESLSRTWSGIVAEIDGEIVAFGGFCHAGGRVIGFCELSEKALPYKLSIHRIAVRMLREQLQKSKFIYANPDPDEPTAERWLRRLGFERLEEVPENLWRISSKAL